MFDISWSELLILGIVTLVFVGPKELPVFLRTIGRYVGVVKRQAAEFREQFDSAMREAELEQIRRDMMNVKSDVEASMRKAEQQVRSEFDDARRELDQASADPVARVSPDPVALPADGSGTSDAPAAPPSADAAVQGSGSGTTPAPSAVPAPAKSEA